MKVVEILGGLELGGAELATLRRLRYQPSGIYTSIIFSGASNSEVLSEFRKYVDQIVEMRNPVSSKKLYAQLNSLQPDVVIVHTPRLAIKVLARRSKRNNFPIVVVAHSDVTSDHPSRRPLLNLGLTLINHRAELHIAVSRLAAQGPWCRRATNLVVCHLGSEIFLNEMLEKPNYWPIETEVRFIAISRLAKPKNLVAAVKAVSLESSMFRSVKAHLAIVGDGPEFDRVKQAISEAKVADIVSLYPATPRVGDALRATDWLFVPSRNEGGPLTVYEGQLAGCRVASTLVGVVPEVLALDHESVTIRGSSVNDLRELLRSAIQAGVASASERKWRSMQGSQWSAIVRASIWYDLLERLYKL